MPARPVPHSLESPLPRIWGRSSFWQIRVRWWIPPLIVLATFVASGLGFDLPVGTLLGIAAGILAYNTVLAFVVRSLDINLERDRRRDWFVGVAETTLDYAATLLLIYHTGGTASPLMYFFLFHVIFAAVQYPAGAAYVYAGVSIGALWSLIGLEHVGWIPTPAVTHGGETLMPWDRWSQVAGLAFFSVTTLFVAGATTYIATKLRRRVARLRTVTERAREANNQLRGLYVIAASLRQHTHLDEGIAFACSELRGVLGCEAVAIKLLSDDGDHLVYAGTAGLGSTEELPRLLVAENPLDRETLEGDFLVRTIEDNDPEAPNPELAALGLSAAASAPLVVDDETIGVLTAYGAKTTRWDDRDADFMRLASTHLASAIQTLRHLASIEALLDERVQFMRRVAHNMRAPIGASLGLLELVRDGTFGELSAEQASYLERVDRRLTGVNVMVGELLALARGQQGEAPAPSNLRLGVLLDELRQLFEAEAQAKSQTLVVDNATRRPEIVSRGDGIQQVLENLVSNAIKYTPEGGLVTLHVEDGDAGSFVFRVTDSGIGIPEDEQAKLFEPFFRASNAKQLDVVGTGLGLALAKQTVEAHGGELTLDSTVGVGTTVRVTLPGPSHPRLP